MIIPERKDELHTLFWQETNEEWTQSWRDDLKEEEAALIDQWENKYDYGVSTLCKSILEVNGH